MQKKIVKVVIMLIKPLMFCWEGFQESIRIGGILRLPVKVLDVNKNDKFD
ncbi:MAG: hypothetical protein ACTS73_01070 [Arsenophonus sp. NEOnobi-MAG3]